MAPVSRVLVADDVQDSADTVADLLIAQGLEARAVYDGRHALTLAAEWRPDGAVLDLALPGITGYDVARSLRREFGPGFRLVAYTGWAGDAARDEARSAGFDHFLVKPVEPAALLLALGKPVSEMVRGSIEARVEQLGRQIELGHSLLQHGVARPEALAVICAFLERAFQACRETLHDLPLSAPERARLEQDLQRIEAEIERVRGGQAH